MFVNAITCGDNVDMRNRVGLSITQIKLQKLSIFFCLPLQFIDADFNVNSTKTSLHFCLILLNLLRCDELKHKPTPLRHLAFTVTNTHKKIHLIG